MLLFHARNTLMGSYKAIWSTIVFEKSVSLLHLLAHFLLSSIYMEKCIPLFV